ncbi:MAG: DUF4197 domain-containing protein [Prolixibacteraceae bacterium]|nr:DUF4197 domain-containing protein [Prolixibacteraceae bacterium]MBN2648816.1 DUF4197 domain-containing protein [Prolixibacteraceae bacterium]
MKQIRIVAFIALLLSAVSCDVLMQTASQVLTQDQPLTKEEVARGLKEALRVGADSALTNLNAVNGYYNDQLVKINLPPETDKIIQYASKVPGISDMIDDVVLQINRSAEDAAAQAMPIFKNAITSMTIEDAWGILRGENNAATQYLNEKTYNQLVSLYMPVMQKSLNKPIVGNVSAAKTWDELTTKWNKFANSVAGRLLDVDAVDTQLDRYVTERALDGVFLKVEDREQDIRTKAEARVNDLLKRVFGSNP